MDLRVQFGIIDHVLMVTLVVALPMYSALVSYPRSLARLKAGVAGQRVRMYRSTMLWQWGLVALALAIWFGQGRTAAGLRLLPPAGSGLWIGAGVTLLGIALLQRQLHAVRTREELREQAREQIEQAAPFAPRTTQQLRWFIALSVTAGICEEVMVRGYLLAYLESFGGLNFAVVGSSVLFGLAHAYQGRAGILKTAIVGLILGSLVAFTGSLWWAVVLHAFVDVNAGQLAIAARGERSG